ncbi:exported protein [Xenorhabdus beddingii]|uniref:Exported protein n=1 Tax=Xenorhabdus beddingii TaxID=40578 RepID=A0A1Y2SLN7_9GAMM|nr:hypothetical protein [Xenorhabdus beddingii]OTA19821.1 exported protein [Xenorhabdus beddingii]
MAETTKSSRFARLLKTVMVIMVMVVITCLAGWAGLSHPEKASALHHWMEKTGPVWRVWRLCLYLALGWCSGKIWQRVKYQPEYRPYLIRMMLASLLFMLLCEYALSDSQGETA